MLTIVQVSINPKVIEYLEENRRLLVPDVSNYAKGRRRAWIGMEAPLTDKVPFKKAPFGYETPLWKWLTLFSDKYLNFVPEVGLVHIGGADCSDPEDKPEDGGGGQCGIQWHRDAGYADFRAIGINLIGNATFLYRPFYPDQDKWSKGNKDAQVEYVKMTTGTAMAFNCKNPHGAKVGPNRWCINAWRISNKRREEFLSMKMGE